MERLLRVPGPVKRFTYRLMLPGLRRKPLTSSEGKDSATGAAGLIMLYTFTV
jgi:hypothetical protein